MTLQTFTESFLRQSFYINSKGNGSEKQNRRSQKYVCMCCKHTEAMLVKEKGLKNTILTFYEDVIKRFRVQSPLKKVHL